MFDEEDARDALADADHDEFEEWCTENDADPEDPGSREEYDDSKSYAKDPYAYNGLSRSDFL
jgi:hypothetical protein